MSTSGNEPRYPIYVISKGRSINPLTCNALLKMKVGFRIVIEPHEYDDYSLTIPKDKILTLPFSNLGQGSIPARNWVWEHSIKEGHARHWILDDNILRFDYFNKNQKFVVDSGVTFRACEDFVDRYSNVAMAGMQYEKFVPKKQIHKSPFIANTRVYSCILLDNKLKFRWRGRYNEDTDLSLRILKSGLCTILFYAFLAEKTTTMRMRGGNTDILYKQQDGFDGRLEMAKSLQAQHPDVTKIVWKWGRWQHSVDYSQFKKNKLIKRTDSSNHLESDYGLNMPSLDPGVATHAT